MNPYVSLVEQYDILLRKGRNYPLGGFPPLEQPELSNDAPVILVFSPHPDDECITGALALRLRRDFAFCPEGVVLLLDRVERARHLL